METKILETLQLLNIRLLSLENLLKGKSSDEIMDTQAVMDLLNISRATYNRLRTAGTIKAYKLKGGKLFHKRSEIMAELEKMN